MLVWFFSFPREAMGASSAPGIPCALFNRRDVVLAKTRSPNASREREFMPNAV
jgi:hypothetical protein